MKSDEGAQGVELNGTDWQRWGVEEGSGTAVRRRGSAMQCNGSVLDWQGVAALVAADWWPAGGGSDKSGLALGLVSKISNPGWLRMATSDLH